MEIRELLTKYEYEGDKASIVFGSALLALSGGDKEMGANSIEKLLTTMDEAIEIPPR